MEWNEFTSYIIDSTRDQDQFRVDALKHYHPSTRIADNNKYHSPIDKVVSADKHINFQLLR